jgi:predicted nucleic acid-binding protein
MIVVDTPAALEVLLRIPVAASVQRRMFALLQSLHALRLPDIEVAQVLGRYALTGQLAIERALADMVDLPRTRYRYDFMFPRISELRDNLTAS